MTIGVTTSPSWITTIKEYIEHGSIPMDPSEATLMKKRVSGYTIIGGTLFKRGLSTPLLICLEKEEVDYALLEVHRKIV